MNKKPLSLLIFKMIGIAGAIAAIKGILLVVSGFGDFESNNFMIGALLFSVGFMLTSLGITIGFAPEIAKIRAKTIKYIQEENKEDLSTIASTHAEIMSDALTTSANALSNGIRKTMFCKHCGAKIDSDSKFCSACGKEQ